jgi:hypothetical protein
MKFVVSIAIIFAVVFNVSAQTKNPFPNELRGYRFYKNGKLKTLRPGVSTLEDIKKVFGEECENVCDYDERWTIDFGFIDDGPVEITSDGVTTKYFPAPGFIGKISSISLHPKSNIRFQKALLLKKFDGLIGGYICGMDGKGGGSNTSYTGYSDRYGLFYNIVDSYETTKKDELNGRRKGDLFSIKYELTEEMNDRIYGIKK